ncbi:MAG TPA: alpha/beta hydrolase-fold protein [Mucilaginibacter sp.]|nr:alpha/beta hydrolase-fold protein [Mucilaginibacter sp.]
MKIKVLLLCIGFTGLFTSKIAAQIHRDSIVSEILHEKRYFRVSFPQGYDTARQAKYDVLYVLDGESATDMITEIQKHVQQWGFAPPLIIVGVENNDRRRDLTPTQSGGSSGGAGAFLSYITKELIPHINRAYHTSGSNSLFGHSYGGLFALYALFTAPDTFDSYIAGDPSLWWDNGVMDTLARQKLPGVKGFKSLYLTSRSGNAYHDMGIDKMEAILRSSAPPGLHWKTNQYDGETHVSAQFKSAYDGIKFSYTGYQNDTVTLIPMGGIAVKNQPFVVRYDEAFARTGYTTDGRIPGENSAIMKDTLTVNSPCKLTVSTLCFHSRFNHISVANFAEGKALPPVAPRKDWQAGGLTYGYYPGNWNKLPGFGRLKPQHTGHVGIDIDIDSLHNDDHFALLVTGAIEIKADGYYTFVLSSDDAASLYIGKQLLIRKAPGDNHDRSFMLPLKKGFYPLRFEYLHRAGTYSINLTWYTPENQTSIDPSSIPVAQLYTFKNH